MIKKLSNEEIRQVNFIRTFDDVFIDSWSLDRDILSMTIIDKGVNYRVIFLISSFVADWFIRIWSVKIAKHCPVPQPISNIYCGYDNVARDHSMNLLDNVIDFSPVDNLINEMYDSDIR